MRRKYQIIRWLMLLGLVTFNFEIADAFAQGVTFSTNSYNWGQIVTSVAVADITGSGKRNLISASMNPVGGPAYLMALTNNGSGVFGSNATLYVDIGFMCVVTGGVNGGGKPDLIFASDYANTLTVVTNDGNGLFSSNATYNVGSYPIYVLAADLNAYGKPDLVCADWTAGTLTVLTNNGSGVFGSNATCNVGSHPICVIAADVNNDGKLDLVCANRDDNTLTLLTNNGSGVFGSNATLNVGNYPHSVVAADLNGDGKPDLVCGSYTGLTVLLNTTPFPPPSLSVVSGNNQLSLFWPGWATNFIVESTTNLSAPEWVTVTNSAPITGGITLTNTSPTVFFRLHQF